MTLALGLAMAAGSARADHCGGRLTIGNRQDPKAQIVGLTADQRLVTVPECAPARMKAIGAVSGLAGADTALVGIDFRIQDGLLYGVGDGGGVYRIDTKTAVATPVSQLTPAPDDPQAGVDFNPAADRLRVISAAGQNLRHDIVGGTTTEDGDLNYNGMLATGVSGAAYTNNDLDPNTGTTLFDIDVTLDQLVIQSPPNAGALAAVGKLGFDASAPVAFDIQAVKDDGVTVRNRGIAAMIAFGAPALYRVNLLTGAATFIGVLPTTLVDLALPILP
jgi:hypothetical protein